MLQGSTPFRARFSCALLCLPFLVSTGCKSRSRPVAVPAVKPLLSADTPTIAGCPVFPSDNVWNTPVDTLPLDPKSSQYIASIPAAARLHPGFGGDPNDGIPITLAADGTKPVPVRFDNLEESDASGYPIPANVQVEGGMSAPRESDRHVIIVEPRKCQLWELYSAAPAQDGSWQAGSGAHFDLTSNTLRPDGITSADAAGLPILAGLVRLEEVQAGAIHHALRFTLKRTRNAYVWPGRHKASPSSDPSLPPMGARFRLRADFDLSPYTTRNQIILTALKRYGMFLADNGGDLYLTGVPEWHWVDDDLHHLSNIKPSDFEVVDETSLQLQPNSGAARQSRR